MWISRSTYKEAVRRYERAEEQVDRLQEHLARVDRTIHGLPEVPGKAKAKDPMPPTLVKLFHEIYGSSSTRTQQEQWQDILKSYDRTGSWEAVETMLRGA